MLLVRRLYPKRLTYSILWAIPTGAIWGEVSCPGTQLHADCSGVWTCAPLIPTPRLYPLRQTPPNLQSHTLCYHPLFCCSLLKISCQTVSGFFEFLTGWVKVSGNDVHSVPAAAFGRSSPSYTPCSLSVWFLHQQEREMEKASFHPLLAHIPLLQNNTVHWNITSPAHKYSAYSHIESVLT